MRYVVWGFLVVVLWNIISYVIIVDIIVFLKKDGMYVFMYVIKVGKLCVISKIFCCCWFVECIFSLFFL